MKNKIIASLIALPMVALCIIPPIGLTWELPFTSNQSIFTWLVLGAGLLSIIFLFTRASWFIKTLVLYLFINCFFSKASYISFSAFLPIIVCAYFYLLCLQLKDDKIVYQALSAVFFLNVILLVFQLFHHDNLLNMGLKNIACFGTVGNPMNFVSFMVILTVILMQKNRWFIVPMILVIFLKHHSLYYFFLLRVPVWLDTIKYSCVYPFFGWGEGMYKVIFPVLSSGAYYNCEGKWIQAHCDYLQILFDIGSIGLGLVLAYATNLLYKFLRAAKNINSIFLYIGLLMIMLDMSVHFPIEQIQTILLIVYFLARYERKIYGLHTN